MIQTAFGEKVKELREKKSISQLELSKQTGIERSQISRIEQGKINVTLDTINKISEGLQIPIITLLDIKNIYTIRPFVKWAGGKTQILDKIKELLPKSYNTYFEPFVGGGALLCSLTPEKAVINDSNSELMAVYYCLQHENEYNRFIETLLEHERRHSEEYYYEIRSMDRQENFSSLPMYIRAARMVYLNKGCFNGLYRVNSKGYFNVPSGKKKKVNVFDNKNMTELHDYFTNNKITILNTDFSKAVESAKEGDFVYFDPPYDVWDDKDSFTSYSKNSFGKKEQEQLANVFKELSKKGVKVMLSNQNTKYINELYKEFNIHVINAKRMINSNADGRGDVEEVIITNY